MTAPPDPDPRPAADRLIAEWPAPTPRAPDDDDRLIAEWPAPFPSTRAQGRYTPGRTPNKRKARTTLTGR